MRAAWADFRGREVVQGGSTITQQYIKKVYVGDDRTLSRKIREAVLAGQLDRKVDKDEILYRYMSTVYYGGGAYGIGAAAESYFKKPVNDLNVSESAMLAGLLSAPSELDPRTNPKQAEANRLGVLDAMLDQKRISAVQHAQAKEQKIFLVGSTEEPPPAQRHPGPPRRAPVDDPAVLRRLRGALPGGQVRRRHRLPRRAQGGDHPRPQAADPRRGRREESAGGHRTAAGDGDGVGGAGDGLRQGAGGWPRLRQVAGQPGPGRVPGHRRKPHPTDGPVCLAGGGTGRQPGSAFKVFTLAKAFEEGIGPRRVYSGPGTYTFPRCSGTQCTVKNVESGSYGSISLREATENSVNTVFAQLVGDVGIKETAEMAHRLGITMVSPDGNQPSGEPYGASLTLGAAEVSPLDMAAAFSVLAARGNQCRGNAGGEGHRRPRQVLEDNTKRAPKRVLAENIADNVNDVLKGVITSGTGKGADIGRPDGSAGKTGSADLNRDAWFVGYTPALSTSVWMGYSDSNTRSLYNIKGVSKVYGGTIPASTWKAFMGEAMKGKPPADFPEPTPLAGDVGAGPRRAPVQLAPEEEPAEQILTVGPPVTLYPQTPFCPEPAAELHHPAACPT